MSCSTKIANHWKIIRDSVMVLTKMMCNFNIAGMFMKEIVQRKIIEIFIEKKCDEDKIKWVKPVSLREP